MALSSDSGADATVQQEDSGDPPTLNVDADVPDALVCDAGAPTLLLRNKCEDYWLAACGGLHAADDAGDLTLVRCSLLCRGTGRGLTPWSCRIYNGPSSALDAGALDSGDAEAGVEDGAPPTFDIDAASGVVFECEWCNGGGRRPAGFQARAARRAGGLVGRYLASMAQLEAASVHAFQRLAKELRVHGAPPELVAEAARAAEDEVRHARAMQRLARSWGAEPQQALVRATPARSLEAIAVENAVEGCVRETFGALVAHWQVAHAADPRIAKVMRRIAHEERRHGALSWAVARWLEPRLRRESRARVCQARRVAVSDLEKEARRSAPEALVRYAGLPRPAEASALFEGLRDLWT